jgi:hypothetical protein
MNVRVPVNRESQTSGACYHRSAICIEKTSRDTILAYWVSNVGSFALKPPDLAGSPREFYYA